MRITRNHFLKAGLSLFGLLLVNSLWVERYFIEINEFFLGSAKDDESDIKVIQVSDLHINTLSVQLKKIAKRMNTISPDLIVITGDAVDKNENLPLLHDFLELIDPTIKKVAILGNWEYWGEVNLIMLNSIYKQHNCDLLINESKKYSFRNRTITVTGVDDYVGGQADIESALSAHQVSQHHIILNHCPEYSEIISASIPNSVLVDCILSGHTHGGQINFFGFIPFKPRGSGKYLKGWYSLGTNNMYVSKGIGTSILPARFMARAEITLFHLSS